MRAPANEADRLARRFVFGEAAEDYAALRPGYPAVLLDRVAEYVPLGPATRVLEVGCGSGQATRLFAARGCEVTALEPDPALRTIARRELEPLGVRILESRFEDVGPGTPAWDVLLCATSFHWLDPATRCRDCRALLRPGGAVVILYNAHPSPYRGFFERVQSVYAELAPEAMRQPTARHDEDPLLEELRDSGEFDPVVTGSADWSREYGRDDYLRLLNTYSDHLWLAADRRAVLFDRIGRLIDREFGGRVVRPYRTVLDLAIRPASS